MSRETLKGFAAGVVAGALGLSMAAPGTVEASVNNPDTNGGIRFDATCIPYTPVTLEAKDGAQTIDNIKRGIIVGDVSIADKGIAPDSLDSTGQMIVIDFANYYDLGGVVSKYGAYLEKINACASNSYFNEEIGRLERKNTPAGNGQYAEETHRITDPYAESNPPTAQACEPDNITFPLSVTAPGKTTELLNIKRAVITGDVTIQGYGPDNDPLTGETVIVDFSSFADLTGIQAPNGGSVTLMKPCATDQQFNAAIGAAEATQTLAHGGQSFKITTP